LEKAFPEIASFGASLVAVSPQLEEFNRRFARERRLTFQLLGDPGNRVARKFSLVFQLPEELRKVYLSFGVDLERFNGDESWTLPMPARFVIDQSGIIRSADVSADYTIRPEPGDTIKVLGCLTETSTGAQGIDFESCLRARDRFGKADARYQLEGG
jgi:peroxiredoxin